MRVTSAVTPIPVARYSPRAPAVLPTAVSATSRCTETLTWQSGRDSRSTSSRPMRISSASEALAVRSKNVGMRGRLEAAAPGNARSTISPSSADAHARPPFGHRQRELAALAATAAHLIPGEITGDVIDAVQRLEQIARQHDILHQLGDLPVPDHVAPARRKGEVLEHRLPAERPAGVDTELDVADEIVETDALCAGGGK